jgi:hypothetical protein
MTAQAPTAPPDEQSGSGRAFILGLIIVAAFAVAGSFSVLLRYEIIGTGYLPRGAVTVLLILVLITWVMRRATRRRGLRRRETLLIFGMLMAMGAVPGQEFSQHVYLNTIGIVYYATPDIAKPSLYLEKLNPYLVPSKDRDDPIIRYAFEGVPPGASVPYGKWLVPLLVWTPFWFALYWVILCFAGLMAHRWEDQEKVLYPLTAVPAELVSRDRQSVASAFRNRLLWVCFAATTAIYILKGLHTYYPGVPDIDMQRVGGVIFAEGPARVFNRLPLHIYPEMIGITYLLSAEVGFSLWFSYWLRLLETFTREAIGLQTNHWDFFSWQTVGGYAVLGMALIWSARKYLAGAFREGLTGAFGRGKPDDPLHTIAAPGFILGMLFVWWWCAKIGMSLTWAIVTYVSFIVVSLVVARVICEAGMFIYSSPFRLNEVIFDLGGIKQIGAQNATLMTMASWAQIRSTATMNLPAVFQGFKLGSLGQIERRRMFWAMYAAVVVAILCAHVSSIYTIYTWSVPKLGWWPQGSSLGATNTLARKLQSPLEMSLGNWGAIGLGGGTTLLLVAMRQRFLWWPWHPLGFVAWLGWPIDRYWLSIFIGWLWKVVVIRVAGFKSFSSFRPAAFGLILGICFILTVWLVVHMIVPGPPVLIE